MGMRGGAFRLSNAKMFCCRCGNDMTEEIEREIIEVFQDDIAGISSGDIAAAAEQMLSEAFQSEDYAGEDKWSAQLRSMVYILGLYSLTCCFGQGATCKRCMESARKATRKGSPHLRALPGGKGNGCKRG
jgi:hypothetical protein